MFLVFLDLTEPAHNIANPACIKNTRYADDNKNWLSEEPVMVLILPAFPAILSAFEFSVTFSAVSFKVSAASVEVRPDKYWQSCSVYINKVKKRAEREKTKTRWSVFILLFCDVTFFFLQSSKIIKMSFMNLRFLNNYLLALHACASYFMRIYLVIFQEHCELRRI